MSYKIAILCFYSLSLVFPKTAMDSEEFRIIRIENIKKNYLGKTIQFSVSEKSLVEGVLVDANSDKFTILMGSDRVSFDHFNISSIYILPKKAEFLLTTNLALFGAAISYLTLQVLREEASHQQKTSFTCLGFVLGGLMGKNTFYKPIKVDISGKKHE